MKTATRLTFVALVLVGAVLLAAQNWSAFPMIDQAPIRNRTTPSTEEGRWIIARASVEFGPAYLTVTAGDSVSPPGCTTGVCPSPYNQQLQVKRGQEVVFSFRSKQWKGRAQCALLAPGESWQGKVPPGARQDNRGDPSTQGGVTCVRRVTW